MAAAVARLEACTTWEVLPTGVAITSEFLSDHAGPAAQTTGDSGLRLPEYSQVMDDIALNHGKMTAGRRVGSFGL